jgi:hypothetical protein
MAAPTRTSKPGTVPVKIIPIIPVLIKPFLWLGISYRHRNQSSARTSPNIPAKIPKPRSNIVHHPKDTQNMGSIKTGQRNQNIQAIMTIIKNEKGICSQAPTFTSIDEVSVSLIEFVVSSSSNSNQLLCEAIG